MADAMKSAPAFLMACASVRLFADAVPPAEKTLPAVIIKGRQDSLLGIADSATAFIQNAGDLMKEAVRKALEADDAADQGSIDAAMAAIDAEVTKIEGASDRLGTALEATAPPAA